MPKFSIIVKINTDEQNLRDCLDSIINQTYKDFEILCLHDYSTGDIPTQILEEYKKQDERIRFVSMQNKSVAAAKNIILNIMQGEYCYFIDSDSTLVYPKFLEYADTIFKNFNIDYFCFGAVETKNHNGQDVMYHDGYSELSFDLRFSAGTFLGNKILKTKIIKDNNIQFPDEGIYENIYFMWCYQFVSKSAYFEDSIFNYYVKNQGSGLDNLFETAAWQMYNWHNLLEFLNNRNMLKENIDHMIYLLDFYTAVTKRLVTQDEKYKVEKLKLTYLTEILKMKGQKIAKTIATPGTELKSLKQQQAQFYTNITNPEIENEKTVSISELMPNSSPRTNFKSDKESKKFYDMENDIEVEIESFKNQSIDYLPNVESIEDYKEPVIKKKSMGSKLLSFIGIKSKNNN